jgi:chromosome partitioning protein
MKTLTIALRKGGTGKSTVATQTAYYLSEFKKKRTLFIDLDDHGATTKLMRAGGRAAITPFTSYDILQGNGKHFPLPEGGLLTFVPSEMGIRDVIDRPEKKGEFIKAFCSFIVQHAGDYDYCVIDTSPSSDIRQTCAFFGSDFVLSPISMLQEGIDALPVLLHELMLIKTKKEEKGYSLIFLGFLPNMYDQGSPLEKKNFVELVKTFHRFMIPMGKGSFGVINKRSVIAEAQALGIPFWLVRNESGQIKTASRAAWCEIAPVFEKIIKLMETTK